MTRAAVKNVVESRTWLSQANTPTNAVAVVCTCNQRIERVRCVKNNMCNGELEYDLSLAEDQYVVTYPPVHEH